VLLAGLGLVLVAGPVFYQGLRFQVPPVFQRWQMFVGKAIDTCQVSYSVVEPDGSSRRLDRHEVLGIPRGSRASRRIHRVARKRVNSLDRRICTAIRRSGVEEPYVRLRARCGSRERWVPVEDGSRNVCATRP
jgi:hypothetical protein